MSTSSIINDDHRLTSFSGIPHPEDEEDVNNTSTASSFKFPFFDKNEDLDLSRSINQFLSPLQSKSNRVESEHANRGEDVASPSGFGAMTLSPIAKNRDSDSNNGILRFDEGAGEENQEQIQEEDKASLPKRIARHSTSVQSQVSTPPHEQDTSSVVDDLQSARKQVGESSSNFINKIRNAAHKRKVAVTRSRDSLVAKEQEQLRSIAESKALKSRHNISLDKTSETKENHPPQKQEECSSIFKNPFKYKKGNGFSGCGVPKVEKRPTTTPYSPLLGSRRKQRVSARALEAPRASISKISKKISLVKRQKPNQIRQVNLTVTKESTKRESATQPHSRLSTSFKARPMPSSTGTRGRAGQLGVPKVPKRPVTVPKSPGLGKKRLSRLDSNTKSNMKVKSRVPSIDTAILQQSTGSLPSLDTRSSTPSNGENSGLLGLHFLGETPQSTRSNLPPAHDQNLTPKFATIKPFEPQSTKRANERAQYDVIRDENRQTRLLEERERLHEQIRTIQRELRVLRDEI
ncbi:hypothetical protein IV203_005210 [Nitzschia inconspicua]|uniref:Uncharacterized protein n=1 Tax=Nitzschia inconspicua TaxID=303405 RepID=A0A9K3KLV0_9STRA|nr:hypothetical protein IV203_005210 [Nitzschia inconspicua]